MSNQIVINDGFKTYELVNKDKKVLGKISFNPSDVNIAQRYGEVVVQLEKIDMNIDTENPDEIAKELKRIDEIIYEKINYLVDADIANTLFSIMGPFSPMPSGQFFVEYILEVIGKIIYQETGARVKKMNKRIQKHTSKYHG